MNRHVTTVQNVCPCFSQKGGGDGLDYCLKNRPQGCDD